MYLIVIVRVFFNGNENCYTMYQKDEYKVCNYVGVHAKDEVDALNRQ